MKRSLFLILGASLLCSLAACHREDPEIELDTASVAVLAEGGNATVSFTCNYKWSAQASEPWITVSPTSGGKGSQTVTIGLSPNTGNSVRSGSVDIRCDDMVRSIRITQARSFDQKLSLVFDGKTLQVPKFLGNGVSAEVDWGDGTKEIYSAGLEHTYGTSGSHAVTINLAGGTSFEIRNAAGITEIDLTGF